jgi:subtilisin family serine protease
VNLSSQTYAERADALRAVAELARRKTVGPAAFSRVVMSCSWRTSGDSAVVRTALEEVVAAGVLTVFSAGNEDNSLPHFPSDYGSWDGLLGRGVVSVAATDRDDRKAAYSNYSPRVNVSAPGGDGLPLDARDILCADQGNSYVYAAGTSIAAPHVAAVAALMLSIDPNLSAEELKNLIVGTADELPATDTSYRNLRLNAGNAIIAARRTAEDAKPDDTPSDDTPVNDRPDTEPKGPAVNVPQVMPAHTALVILETLRVTSDQLQAATGWSLIEGRLTNGSSEITIAVTETDTP